MPNDLRQRIAAIVFYETTGYDLDVASAGARDADAAFDMADALIRAGVILNDTDTHWANGQPRLLRPEAYERLTNA